MCLPLETPFIFILINFTPKSTSLNINEFNIKLKLNNIRNKSQIDIMDYTKKTQKELKELCKEQKIKSYSNKNKDELIKLLSKNEQPIIKKNYQNDNFNYNELLDKILLCEEIETIHLYEHLCKINKTEHVNGVYYTSPSFFKDILNKIKFYNIINNETRTLDFCCGTGNLFISYLDILITKCNELVIKNIILKSRFLDIDGASIIVFKLKLYCWIKNNLSINIDTSEYINNFYTNDGLIEIHLFTTKFDIILSNPPFINLKSNIEYKKKIKDLKYYQYTVDGMMDTYLVSIERILKLLDQDGRCIIICPSQLLTNISCLNIRKHIIDILSINNIFKFSEKNTIFSDITQSICVLDMTNNTQNNSVQYFNCDYTGEFSIIDLCIIDKNIYKSNNYNIIYMTNLDSEFLSKLIIFPKIKSYKSMLKCSRGDIDVTLDKSKIINDKTTNPLVRGRNITSLDTITEFISSSTIDEKNINITNKKLVCQQISNMESSDRIKFTLLESTFIISNSCNYIIMTDDKHISNLKHILNSKVLNRYFSIFSGNNHISINELNNFPLPNIFDNFIDLDNLSLEEREIKICQLYNLSNIFISNYFGINVENSINKTLTIYNHISQKMSALEQTMAIHITPGGNWKNIPDSINESKRLNKIRETGGRTTLYGRLDYNKPGFTITTQFSRLPNSSNLHPKKNRMITIREAGIIQSFPLDFKFSDNKDSAITQIGNAVPPILARFIANFIKKDIINKNTLDLFSGVGGMSIGFSQEGFNIVLSNELDNRLANEKENSKYHNKTMFVCGDICDSKIKKEIQTKLEGIEVGVIIGGPPCQGFSLAGKRDSDDSRNKLYLEYFKMIELYNPECFVMENVKGILSMKNEKKQLVIDEIKDIAGKIGYKLSIFNLNACDFAVPQKRERVFIIGHKKKEYEKPQPIIKKEKYITIKDAIQFLEKYDENKELIIEDNELNNNYIKYLSNSINLQELYKSYA